MNTNWHWTKDGDFPKEDMRVYCVTRDNCFGEINYSSVFYYYTNDYRSKCVSFNAEENVEQKGFYYVDREYGPIAIYGDEEVLCWHEIPELPSLPKEFNNLEVQQYAKLK